MSRAPFADDISVLAVDIFGTTVDWRTGVADQVGLLAAERGVALDSGSFTDDWRDRYLPAVARVRAGQREWCHLDTLHREALDDLLDVRGIGTAFDEAARATLVRAWHRLPPWADAAAGLGRLRTRYVVAAVSNGGFALLTNLVKAADLGFDCIISADLARSFKPDPAVYRVAAGLLDVRPDQVLMVAAHGWDLAGAAAAGLRTAFVERPAEKGPDRQADRPGDVPSDLSVADFHALAEELGC